MVQPVGCGMCAPMGEEGVNDSVMLLLSILSSVLQHKLGFSHVKTGAK